MQDYEDVDASLPGFRRTNWRKAVRPVAEILLIVAVVFTLGQLSVQTARVEGSSMNPTLKDQDLLVVDKLTYRLHAPSRGDIVIFNENEGDGNSRYLVKRVIGLPGDIVEIVPNYTDPRFPFAAPRPVVEIKVGGVGSWERLDEAYLGNIWGGGPNDVCCSPQGLISKTPTGARVPSNEYFLLGDNRDNSTDSRFLGFIPRSEILGRAFLRILPMQSLGSITDSPTLQPA